MKRRDLIKKIEDGGAVFIRHGGKHDWYQNPKTKMAQPVPRHTGIKSVDVIVPVRRGDLTTELRLRVVTTSEPATAQLLAHFGLRLPKGTRKISHVVPKTTS